MTTLQAEAAHWFTRAAELRTFANDLADPEAKCKVLEVAEHCMTIARSAEAGAKAHEAGDHSR
jgi:hypothetical protein